MIGKHYLKKEETIFIDNRRIWSEIYEWKIY